LWRFGQRGAKRLTKDKARRNGGELRQAAGAASSGQQVGE